MPLRSPEMQEKYSAHKAQYKNFTNTKNFNEDAERLIRNYTYWYIIPNLFPYDAVTSVHDMLVPHRIFSTMSECNQEERQEYEKIIDELEKEKYYDAIIKNFSKIRSIPRHLHLHLVIWK